MTSGGITVIRLASVRCYEAAVDYQSMYIGAIVRVGGHTVDRSQQLYRTVLLIILVPTGGGWSCDRLILLHACHRACGWKQCLYILHTTLLPLYYS